MLVVANPRPHRLANYEARRAAAPASQLLANGCAVRGTEDVTRERGKGFVQGNVVYGIASGWISASSP